MFCEWDLYKVIYLTVTSVLELFTTIFDWLVLQFWKAAFTKPTQLHNIFKNFL